jgi:hypothetical protein
METEITPKKKKQINRNGWQCRLYRWTWEAEPKFTGYCPFFWATLVNIGFIPFVAFGKTLAVVGETIQSFKPVKVEEVEQEYDNPHSRPDDWEYISDADETIENYYPEWVQNNPNWKERANLVREKDRILTEKKACRDAKIDAVKQKIVNVLKWFVFPALISSALAIVWLLYKLALHLFNIVEISEVFEGLKIVAGSIVAYFILKFSIIKVYNALNKWNTVKEKLQIEKSSDDEPSAIRKGLSLINEICSFLYDAIRITYKKECPLIEWSDETKPIERNTQPE